MTAARHRVLLADDEALARTRLRALLAPYERYEIVAECRDGDSVLASAAALEPDVVFLDIRMPGRNGIETAHALIERSFRPLIVFVTAFDEFALQAFEVSAVDYLVKPVDIDRFDLMLNRIERQLSGSLARPIVQNLRALLEDLRAGPTAVTRFLIRNPRGHYFVKAADIEFAQADGNYIALSAHRRTHLIRETMRAFEAKIDADRFLRIHRSIIVNIDEIARIESLGHSEYRVIMKSGVRLESSRTYADRFRALFG